MNTVALKNNLRAILDKKKLPTYRLATQWGKHPNKVYQMVGRDYWPDNTRLITMVELSRLLDVSIDQLFDFENGNNEA